MQTVNILAGDSDDAVHDKVTTALGQMLPGFTPRKLAGPQGVTQFNAPGLPSDIGFDNTKPVVHIGAANAGSRAVNIGFTVPIGWKVVQETTNPPPGIPTLNEWGMALVVGLLLAASFYLLRRRRRQAPV